VEGVRGVIRRTPNVYLRPDTAIALLLPREEEGGGRGGKREGRGGEMEEEGKEAGNFEGEESGGEDREMVEYARRGERFNSGPKSSVITSRDRTFTYAGGFASLLLSCIEFYSPKVAIKRVFP